MLSRNSTRKKIMAYLNSIAAEKQTKTVILPMSYTCLLYTSTTGKVYPGAALMEAGILLPAAVSEYEAYQIELERV